MDRKPFHERPFGSLSRLLKMSLMRCSLPHGIPLLWRILVVAAVAVLLVCPGQVLAAGRLQEFLPKAQPAEFFPGADRFGPPQGEPPLVPA